MNPILQQHLDIYTEDLNEVLEFYQGLYDSSIPGTVPRADVARSLGTMESDLEVIRSDMFNAEVGYLLSGGGFVRITLN